MKALVTILLIVFSVSLASASPFLVCDPQEGVETYEIFSDGVLLSSDIAAQPDGSLRYDLSGVTPGIYTFTVKACEGMWGCSQLSDPFVSDEPVLRPTGLRMTR